MHNALRVAVSPTCHVLEYFVIIPFALIACQKSPPQYVNKILLHGARMSKHVVLHGAIERSPPLQPLRQSAPPLVASLPPLARQPSAPPVAL